MVFTNETVTYAGSSDFKTEEDAGSLIVVPIDLGIRFAISPSFSATLHGGTRATFSDLLEATAAAGHLSLERDEERGNYKVELRE